MFVFIQGLVVGVLLTVGSFLFALFHAKRTLEPNPKQPTEHKMTRSLFDIDPQSRDGWLNHLIHFLYREFQHSDSFHNFALKKMKEELNDIRNGTAKNILHTLDLNCYNFGTEFPVLGKFKLTEPEGFDPDDLPNSIGIDFDLNYDASNSNQQPFEVSAVAGPKIVSAKIKVTIKVHKVSGRMRIRLSRDPSPYWYASFVEQPKLDIKISTDFKSKYSNTIEELFSRHLERMIMKRHVVPKYKVRYSPFFSDRYFKFNTNDAIPLQLSCNLGITVEKGRAFMTKHAQESPSSTIFISFLLSNHTWEETLSDPRCKFSETQTDDYNLQQTESEEFVTLTTSKTNQLIADDETENEVDTEPRYEEKVQVGVQSKRTRILAFGSKVKEMAKEKVKEKIEPVITKRRNQKSEGQASSSSPNLNVTPEERDSQSNSADRLGSQRSLGSDSPQPSGLRLRSRRAQQDHARDNNRDRSHHDESADRFLSPWEIISAQQGFHRTKQAIQKNGDYQWKYEKINAQLEEDVLSRPEFLLIGVWEKPNGDPNCILIGQSELKIEEILAKSSETQDNNFKRKIYMSQPANYKIDHFLSDNRGFRKEMSFGEMTLNIEITPDDEKENNIEHRPTQTDELPTENKKGGNLVTNISSLKQKIWGGGSSRNAADNQSISSKSPLLPSLSDSQLSISSIKTKDGITPKSSQTSLNETGNDKNNDDDEFYDSNDRDELEGIEVAQMMDEKDQGIYGAANKHYGSLAGKTSNDMLAAMAKEEGKSLHRDLPDDERRSELEQCIAKVEREIDDETSRLRSLEIEIRNPTKRCKAEIDLQKCKDRLESLTMLNMQYKSGMEDADSPRCSPDD